MDVAETDEIKALLRKAQQARGCKGPLVLLLLLCVFSFFFSGLESCLFLPLRKASASHVKNRCLHSR